MPLETQTVNDDNDFLNNTPAFGFDGVEERVISLFMRRKDERDDLNSLIIDHAIRGFLETEFKPYGVPVEMLQQLSTGDIIALYSGMDIVNEINRNLGGLKFGKLVSTLITKVYIPGGEDFAYNGILAMRHGKTGYVGHSKSTIEERLDSLKDEVKIQFLRTFYIPKELKRSFPARGELSRILTPGYRREHVEEASYDRRRARIKYFIDLIRNKTQPEPDESLKYFDGWVIQSSRSGNEYFVQQNGHRFDCTCPWGWTKLMSVSPSSQARNDCKHISQVKEKYVT